MTESKCIINLKSVQKMGADKDINNEQYEGTIATRGDKKYLSYKRPTEDGLINCLISFSRKSLTLTQKGKLNSKLELIPGQETLNVYSTQVGTLDLRLYTRHYSLVETKDLIKILLDYDIITGTDPIQTAMDIVVELK